MSILNYLPLLLVIFIGVFTSVLLARFILTFLLNRSYQRYLKLKKITKKILPKRKNKFEKEEEVLRRTLDIPRANSELQRERNLKKQQENHSYELIESQQNQEEINDVEIVDFVKPIGFWTSMILGQKLTYLIQSAQVLNKRGKKGFWVSMIEAKDRAAGRQHGRSR